ncbi:MAG: hypothetical protein SynsKO_10620 [Synoicihabitans sp.]
MFRRVSFPRTVFLSCGLFAASVLPLSSATFTWNLPGGGDWDTNGNWDPSGPPSTADTAVFGSAITGSANVTIATNSTVTQIDFNNSTYSYTVSSSGGDLSLNDRMQVLAGHHFVSADLVMLANSTLQVADGTSLGISGNLSGAFSVDKSGAGTATLSGTNTYSGGTTISGGILAISANANLGASSGGLSIDNATLQIGGDFTFNHATTVANGAMIKIGSSTLDWDKRILGSGGLTISGSGGTITSFQDHDFTDGLTLEDVTFRTGSYGNLGETGEDITLDGGTIYQTNASNRDTSRTINLIGDGGTFDGDGGNSNLTATVTGDGSLTKDGSNRLVLSGITKTYTGATVVNEGTLRLNVEDAIAKSSGVTLADVTGVTLDLNNTNQTIAGLSGGGSNGGNITLGSGTLTVDTTATTEFAGIISETGDLTKSGSGNLELSGNNTFSGDTSLSAGALTVGHDNALGTGTLDWAGGTLVGDGTARALANTLTASDDVKVGGSSALTFSGGFDLEAAAPRTFNISNSADTIFSGVISNGAITKSGTGNLILSGTSTYTGATTINAGTVQLGASDVLSDSTAVTVGASGTLDLNDFSDTVASFAGSGAVDLGSGTLTSGDVNDTAFSGVISGTGGFTKAGSGTLTLSGTNTYSGGTSINAGTIQLGADDVLSNLTAVTVGASGTLDLDTHSDTVAEVSMSSGSITGTGTLTGSSYAFTDTGTVSVALGGSGGLTKTGAGTVTLSGANSYAGGTTISSGILTGTTTSLQGNITNNAGLTFHQDSSGTYSSRISGTGSLTKSGIGRLTLTGANTYSGGTTISAGVLEGTTTSLQGNITNNSGLTFSQSSDGTFSDIISGSGSVTKSDFGTLTLTGANTYTGGTFLFGGPLEIGHDSALGTGSLLVTGQLPTIRGDGTPREISNNFRNAGFLEIGGTSDLTFSGETRLDPSSQLNVTNSANTTFSGILDSPGSIIKSSTGTLTLSGNNTYSGGTTLSGGTLVIGHDNALGSGTLTFDGGQVRGDGTAHTLSNTLAASDDVKVGGSSALTFSGGFDLEDAAPRTFNISNSADTTFSGVISNGALTKTGTGNLILSGTNTYTGATTITAGILRVGEGGTTGSITGNVVNNANLSFNRSDNTTYGGDISGTGLLTQGGSGVLTLTGNNTYSGGSTISAGTLRIGGGGTTGSITGNVVNNANLSFNRSDNTTYDGAISGTGLVTQDGSGVLTLSGTNTYSGGTDLSGGTLELDSSGAIGSSGTISFGGGTLRHTSSNTTDYSNRFSTADNQAYTVDTNGEDITWATALTSSGGSLKKTGTGTLILTGANTYSGETDIDAGTLRLGSSEVLSDATRVDVGGSGALDLAGFNETIKQLTGSGSVTLGSGTLTTGNNSNHSFSGIISGTGSLIKTGNSTFTLSGVNSYSGDTTIQNGILKLGRNEALADSTGVTINSSATLNLNGNTETVYSLAGTGTVNFGSLSGNLIVSGDSNQTFSGQLSGGFGRLTKQGSGTLTLDGSDHHAGNIDVESGILAIDVINVGSFIVPKISAEANLQSNVSSLTLYSLQGAGVLDLGSGNLDLNGTNGIFSGVIQGAGALNVIGSTRLSGANTYTGNTAINSTLTLESDNVLPDSTVVSISSGTLLLEGNTDQIANLSGTGTVKLGGTSTGSANSQGSLHVGNANNSTFVGSFEGTDGRLIKTGTGTLDLSSSTFISEGGVGDPGAFGSSADGGIGGNGSDGGQLVSSAGNLIWNSGTLNLVGSAGGNGGTSLFGQIGGQGGTGGEGGRISVEGGALALTATSVDFSGGVGGQGGQLFSNTSESGERSGHGGQGGTGGTISLSSNTLTLNSSSIVLDGGKGGAAGILGIQGDLGNVGAGGNGGGISMTGGNLTLQSGSLSIRGGDAGAAGGADAGNGGNININDGTFDWNGGTIDLRKGSTGSGGSDGALILNGGRLETTKTRLNNGTDLQGDFTFTSGTLSLDDTTVTLGDGSIISTALPTTLTNHTVENTGNLVLEQNYTLSTNSAFNAATIDLSSNHLTVGTGGTSGSASGNITNGTSLTFNRSNNLTFAGNISGTGELIQNGSGVLTLSGTNTYSGDTDVNAGILRIGAAGALSPNTTLHVAPAAKFEANGHAASFAQLNGTGDIDVGTGGLTVAPTSGTNHFQGRLIGSGGLIKNGAGVLELSGTHTFTGQTQINAGRIRLTGSAASSAFRIENGGTLAGTGTLGSLTLASGGTLAPGASPGTLSAGNTIWNGGATFDFEIDNATGIQGTNWDLLAITGTLTINAIADNQFTLNVDTLLNGTNTAGAMANFDADTTQSWTFATTTAGISFGENASVGASFALDTTGFANPTNGTFSISQIGNNLALTYTTSAVPEPSSFALILSLFALGFKLTQRRMRQF